MSDDKKQSGFPIKIAGAVASTIGAIIVGVLIAQNKPWWLANEGSSGGNIKSPEQESSVSLSGSNIDNIKTSEQEQLSPLNNLDISGTWRDSTGTVYQITQRGKTFEFTTTNPSIGVSSRGSGTINGQDFESVFTTNLPSSGSGVGKISADGSQITGTFDDPSVGRYTRTLYR